jgi:protein-tyrosine phosphatase
MMISPSLPAAPWAVPWRKIARVLQLALAAVVVFLVLGNLAIATAWQIQSRSSAASLEVPAIAGVKNLRAVDEHVWRGAAPSKQAYADLADAGVATIVDLRAEANVEPHVLAERAEALGMRYVHIPMRDGQAPTSRQVERFLGTVRDSDGITYVHCGAGVGRTGAMAAAYLVASGDAGGVDAMRRNLAVGPPSLEQLVFAATLDGDGTGSRPTPVVAASRLLDAPRRLWSRYGL